ncbi:MAG: HEAT repeat domain-containing protein [Solirubrobacterales bacterium]
MLKQRVHLVLIVTLLLACAGQTLAQTVAAKGDEPKLIAVLKDSNAPLKAKIDACRQLAIVGGKDSIAPLAALLGDEQLSHNARYALQMNPDPAVDEALRSALGTVKGRPLVGVIHTVGYRHDTKAVATLASLVNSGNPMVVDAAARALGSIGNSEVAQALQQALPKVPAESKLGVYDGLGRCAESFVAQGKNQDAIAIYASLYKSNAPHHVRGGALRATILASDVASGQKLLQEQLANSDYILFSAAVQASHLMRTAEVTTILTGATKTLDADHQIVVIQSLGVRGDKGAIPALLSIAQTGEPRVRVAAIQAATELGDESAVPVLVQLMDDNNGEIAKAARECLAAFPGPKADAAVMQMFAGSDADKQHAALDLMGRRRMTSGLPALVKVANTADSKIRTDAIKMIGELGGPDQLPTMFELLKNVQAFQELAAVEQSLTAICLRTADSDQQARQVVGQLDKAEPVQKASLVRVLGALGGPSALQAVSACAKSDNADVRSAAARALGTWKTVDAAPSLLTLAKETSNPTEKTLFVRGYLSLAARGDVQAADRVAMCRQAVGLIARDEEKRQLLGTLSNIESPEAMDLISPYVDDAGVRQEAALATATLAEKLLKRDDAKSFAEKLVPTLEKAAQAASDATLSNRIKTALQQAKDKAGAK